MRASPDIPRSEHDALMVLNALEGWGPVTATKALKWLAGDFEKLFGLSVDELAPVVGRQRALSLNVWSEQFDLEGEKTTLQRMQGRYVIASDPEYPELLKGLPDRPLGLYLKGQSPLRLRKSIAIVGTRKATSYGQKVTQQLVPYLVEAGFTIVSGMALGIDTIAHEATLRASGQTAAVFGNGLNIVYPQQNRKLYQEISDKGVLVSEFSLGRRPDRQSFPQRNRLVSGMTSATLVVESASKGGSLITARFAMEQNRTVFAVPGRLDQPQSMGCLELIRDGATLVTSVDDILQELQFMQLDLCFPKGKGAPEAAAEAILAELCGDEKVVYSALPAGETVYLDDIAEVAALPSHQVQAALMMLELKGHVVRTDGGCFERA